MYYASGCQLKAEAYRAGCRKMFLAILSRDCLVRPGGDDTGGSLKESISFNGFHIIQSFILFWIHTISSNLCLNTYHIYMD